jgi:membrane protein DedA with SNARE-associated domain
VLWLPAAIVGAGLVGAVFILLGRAFANNVRESGHPRLIVGGLVALLGVIVLLTYLGVSLPKEG